MNDEFLKGLKKQCSQFISNKSFDCLALGIVDFKTNSFRSFEINSSQTSLGDSPLWFDLASLSKPLNLGSLYLKNPNFFDEKMIWLLEHCAGLKAWALLSPKNYSQQLLSYPLKKSKTLYSDLSALRLMLEIEKKSGQKLEKMAPFFWDSQLNYWRHLSGQESFPITGWRRGPLQGEVHDPNAFNLQSYTAHAGLFATISGLCRSLLNLSQKTSFVEKIGQEISRRIKEGDHGRFVWGWDRAQGEQTLAGRGAGELCFGHLGFTGTMFWIHPQKKRAYILLSNLTKLYWYHEREALNKLRRKLGEQIWQE